MKQAHRLRGSSRAAAVRQRSVVHRAACRLLALIVLAGGLLGCNLTSYRPTPAPPTVGPGTNVNPYLRANLIDATAAQVQVRDTSGAFVAAGTITGRNLDALLTALNVSTSVTARSTCPDHVRLTFVRPDASQIMLTACLDGVVILRGLPGAESYDAPLFGAASDALSPFLPAELQALLDF
ncbi:MAG: hypothetical protein Kow00120_20070 [Anaerolineae bacterium]